MKHILDSAQFAACTFLSFTIFRIPKLLMDRMPDTSAVISELVFIGASVEVSAAAIPVSGGCSSPLFFDNT